MTAYDEAIEKMAKAFYDREVPPGCWDGISALSKSVFRNDARAAAEAIGLREMMDAAACWDRLSDFRNHVVEQLIEQTAAHLKTNNSAK
jgi:hypothetical protein